MGGTGEIFGLGNPQNLPSPGPEPIKRILDAYLSFKNVILAILINKSGDEFTISWPKTASFERHHSVIDRFLESAREVWTTTDYIKQNPKFICDPMIWFYENRKPIEE